MKPGYGGRRRLAANATSSGTGSLGLTISEYLRQCHKRAVEALRKG